MAANEVLIKIKAQDSASGPIGGIKGALKSIPIPAVAAVAAIAGIGAIGIKVAMDFDKSFNIIRVGTGATGDALDDLTFVFKKVLKDVPDSMETVATAIADVNTRMGLTGPALNIMTMDFLDLARVTGDDVADSIAATSRAFGDWDIQQNQTTDTMNHAFKVSQATGIGYNELLEKVVNFGAPMRAFGFSFEEATVLMGKWEKEGVNSEAILAGLKMGIAKFAEAEVDADVGLQQFIDSIQELGPGAEATALAMKTFGSRAGPDMVAAVLEGRFAIEDMMATVAEAGDTIFDAAQATLTLGDRFSILKNKVLVAAEPALTKMLEKLEEAMIAVTPWVEKHLPLAVAFLQEKWVELQPHLEEFVTFIRADVMPVIQDIIKLVEDNWPIISEVIDIAMARVTFTIETAANTIRFIMAVLRGDWSEAWQQIKNQVDATWESIKEVVTSAIAIIVILVGDMPQKILDALGDVGDVLVQAGKDMIQGFIDGMTSIPIPNPLDLIPGGGIIKKGVGLLGFAGGGIVPGPIGAPRLAVVHGGEEVRTPSQRGGATIQIYINAASEASEDAMRKLAVIIRREIEDLARTDAYGGALVPDGAFVP